ncbi:MAG: hypothetical protein KAS04_00500, partial [Candidatus Aenigmarchaeota archaeon]|nr:hypothetical protein [Candidatus Aenigmarchaeota archaeon]
PEERKDEIKCLMQGFGGYKHIRSINGKIALEVPAREFIQNAKFLLRAIDYWLNTVKEFNIFE